MLRPAFFTCPWGLTRHCARERPEGGLQMFQPGKPIASERPEMFKVRRKGTNPRGEAPILVFLELSMFSQFAAQDCKHHICDLNAWVVVGFDEKERVCNKQIICENNMKGLESWAWLPKFCRTFGALCEGSPTGFLLCARLCRTLLQNP